MDATRGRAFDWEGLEETLCSGLAGVIREVRKPELSPDYKLRLVWEWVGLVLFKLIEAMGENPSQEG